MPAAGKLKICLVGKFPPIQGGVSSQTYWAAQGLAARGHEVFVVTNADEVEEQFRIRLGPEDAGQLAPRFANGGAVHLLTPEPYSPRTTHIPRSNPFVSKLAGLATQVVRAHGCDVLVGSYYEPYGVAASLASSWTGVPVLLQHAGSDLDRLMALPEFATTYTEMLRAADGVMTQQRLVTRMLGLGIGPGAIRMNPPYAMPECFGADAAPLTVQELTAAATAHPERAFDPALPTIGMYGKPGVFKGTYDLIAALGALRASGAEFNLLLLSGGASNGTVHDAVRDAGIDDRTWVLPFLPHWTVPRFIRTCTAVCFLERDFPVAIHGPVIPREVMRCGTCLIVSGEIHAKQANVDHLVDGETVVLVPDPKDLEALGKQLRWVIEQPAAAAGIGARGRLVAAESASFEVFVDVWEDLLRSVLPGAPAYGGPVPGTADIPVRERLAVALPWADHLAGDRLDDIAAGARDESDLDLAAALCAALTTTATGALRDAARFQRLRSWATSDPDGGAPLPTDHQRPRWHRPHAGGNGRPLSLPVCPDPRRALRPRRDTAVLPPRRGRRRRRPGGG